MASGISATQRAIIHARNLLLKPAPAGVDTTISFNNYIHYSDLPSSIKRALITATIPSEPALLTAKIVEVVRGCAGFSSFTLPGIPEPAAAAASAPSVVAPSTVAVVDARGTSASAISAGALHSLIDMAQDKTVARLAEGKDVGHIMRLDPSVSALRPATSIDIRFTTEQLTLIRALYANQGINALTLFDLYGCHMHASFERLMLEPSINVAAMRKFQNLIDRTLLLAQLSMDATAQLDELEVNDMPTGRDNLFISPTTASMRLEAIKGKLRSSIAKLDPIQWKSLIERLLQIIEKLTLGQTLFDHPHAHKLNSASMFEFSNSLPEASQSITYPMKNRFHNLIGLIDWLSKSVAAAMNSKEIEMPPNEMDKIALCLERLKNLSAQLESGLDVQLAKQWHADLIILLEKLLNSMTISTAALEFLKKSAIPKRQALRLTIQHQHLTTLAYRILSLCVDIFEKEILVPLFPDRFPLPVRVYKNRFLVNALSFAKLLPQFTLLPTISSSPTLLTHRQTTLLNDCFAKLTDNIDQHKLLYSLADKTLPFAESVIDIPKELDVMSYAGWCDIIEQLIDAVTSSGILEPKALEQLREQQLKEISTFIQQAGLEFSRHDRAQVIDSFIECFQLTCAPMWKILYALDLMMKDASVIIARFVDAATLPPAGSSPFSEALTDCLLLKGLPELFDKLLPSTERPLRGFAAKSKPTAAAAAPPPRRRKTRKAPTQGARGGAAAAAAPSRARRKQKGAPKSSTITVVPPSATRPDRRPSITRFDPRSIRNADNLRKILAVITRETGLHLTFDHGSHHATLETADGKAVAPVPYHGGGSTTASPGVIADIRRSVAAAAAANPSRA